VGGGTIVIWTADGMKLNTVSRFTPFLVRLLTYRVVLRPAVRDEARRVEANVVQQLKGAHWVACGGGDVGPASLVYLGTGFRILARSLPAPRRMATLTSSIVASPRSTMRAASRR
jgi:hypothetical protein